MNSIYILGAEYSVEYVEPHDPRIDGDLGVARHRTQSILIANDLAPETTSETILHEVIHCVDLATCSNDILREDQVARISRGLFSVLSDKRNNGWLEE